MATDESETTAEQFDRMWTIGTPVATRVRRILDVDFNNVRADGRVIAAQCAFAPLRIGDLVIAQDESENVRFDGEVTGMRDDGTRLYLTMDWENA